MDNCNRNSSTQEGKKETRESALTRSGYIGNAPRRGIHRCNFTYRSVDSGWQDASSQRLLLECAVCILVECDTISSPHVALNSAEIN